MAEGEDSSHVFACVVRAMGDKGIVGPLEEGFLRGIGDAALSQ